MTNEANVSSADKSKVVPNDSIPVEVLERFKDDLFKQKNANNDLKKQLEEATQKLNEYNLKEQEKAGNFEEVKKAYEEKISNLESKFKETRELFVNKTLFKTLKTKAEMKGCKDSDVFLKLLNKDQVKNVMTEDFDFDDSKINELIENVAKEKTYLFEGSASKVKDVPPTSKHQVSEVDFKTAIAEAKTQKEVEAVMKKYNKI
jgi:hypothetical protein